MSDKKYVSLNRLANYDALIKAEIVEGDTNAVSSAVNTSKSYTNSEINKLKDGTTTVAKATSATSATSATKATQDGNGKTISSTYETKSGVDSKISTHDTSTSAHSDIRGLITALTTKLNNFLDVDDTTSDQLSEVLTLIENNKGTLESLTTSKVNVSDIIDNLTTSSASKVLSAKQGVAIKSLIDTLQTELDGHGHEISDVSGLQSALNGKSASGHTHSYAGSSSVGGAATSANKINTDAGSATNPVYFSNGVPVKTTYTLEASVPSGAKFTDTTYSNATPSAAGLMSAADKTKLDGIATGANKTTVDSALSSSSTNPVQNKVVNSALAGKVPTTRTVNSKALSADITLSAEDVGAMASTGGTFSNWAHRIEKSDVAGRLISARDRAITRTTAGHATSFCCGTSLKTVNGTWDVGTTADNLYFNYATDTNFNAGTNSVLTGLRITETGAVVLAAGSFGSTLPSTGVKGQIFFKI